MTPRGDGVTGGSGPARTGRRSDSRDVRAEILETALTLLASGGLDALTLPRLAASAGVSTGPVYNRWDSGEDVALELWDSLLFDRLDSLLEHLDAAMGPDGRTRDVAVAVLVGELTRPSRETLALTEVLLVMRRYPWLGSAIAANVDARLWAYVHARPHTWPSYRLGHLDLVLGSLSFGRLLENLDLPWEWILETARDTFTGRPDVVPASDDVVNRLPPPAVVTGEDVVDRFLTACYTVIGRGGYDKASAQRISREAGLTFSHVYNHFDTKHELTDAAVSQMLRGFHNVAVRVLRSHDSERFVTNVSRVMRGLWDESSLQTSRLRAEITIAARHHPELGSALCEGFTGTWDLTVKSLGKGEMPEAAHMNVQVAACSIGLSLLALIFPSGREIDALPVVRAWAHGVDILRTEMALGTTQPPSAT